jgi:malate synthase G
MTADTHAPEVTYYTVGHLKIHQVLFDFVNDELLPDTGVTGADFWAGVDRTIHLLAPRNQALLARRDFLQQQIDQWHQQNPEFTPESYRAFLQEIGYLLPTGAPFQITTENVDAEIATLAGPQLVVPVMNARFALNACNARWGSLYDALYGSDMIEDEGGAERGDGYNPLRGARVMDFGRDFLDAYFPLAEGSHHTLKSFVVDNGELIAVLIDGSCSRLADTAQFRGYQGAADKPDVVLLRRHGLHVEVHIDGASSIGAQDAAGIRDLILESALTTIMDCEDSVAAVDALDKVQVYRNWLGLMRGALTEEVSKNGRTFTRKLNSDHHYTAPDGSAFALPGRSLMFIRNVGHHMLSDAILDRDDQPVPEGIIDGFITSAAALHDLNGNSVLQNSRTGSVYIVKPKMHGPEEVAFTNDLFARIEDVLKLPRNTLKIGIMDEERRTTVNLGECIRTAKERVVFINTGFLDRTGDEIHTDMEAGEFAPKGQLKNMPWIAAYERWNVAVGLVCGLHGKAQIGKGMWAQPDNMAAMLTQKIVHPKAGATTAWVPSPTAATLHAIHYHEVNVASVQEQFIEQLNGRIPEEELQHILDIPLLGTKTLTDEDIRKELENNCQGILGYVVRWIDQGIGCSKVPDIHHTQLMEDRATLRISSQHIVNWLHHGICTEEQVMNALYAMAKVVDQQNAQDPNYQPMADNFANNLAFAAAKDLIFKGREQPNGYTEALLHFYRRKKKCGVEPRIVFSKPEPKVCGVVV